MNELPATFKVATIWLLLAVAMFLGVQAWQREAQRTRFEVSGDQLKISRGPDGHYHWPGRINGQAVDFLVDTGATRTAISSKLARQLELRSQGSVTASTAGGLATGELVRADIVLEGGVRVSALRITALPGLGGHPLLGMDVLGKLRWSQQSGVLHIDLRASAAP